MKVVLITGGAKGIGAAIAKQLAASNYHVIVNYKTSKEQAEELSSKYSNIEIYQADVTKKQGIEKMVEDIIKKHERIDVLINNAAISQIKPFADIEENDWDNMIETNLKSVYLATKAVIHNMIQNKSGTIINISSIWGLKGASCEVHYSAAKAGIIGMTKALAKEMALSNITVNAIAPGIIETDMNTELSKNELKEIEKEIPLGRIGKPEEVAQIVNCLIESTYITGQVVSVDGGWGI